MRIYKNVNVEMTYQNFGSAWLCILRGSTKDINEVFNGLYNFGATNGDIEFHYDTIAIFWTTPKAMEQCFYDMHYIPRYRVEMTLDPIADQAAKDYATAQIKNIKDNCYERFMQVGSAFEVECHSLGQITAERPDTDFKDAVLSNAFDNRNLDFMKVGQDKTNAFERTACSEASAYCKISLDN